MTSDAVFAAAASDIFNILGIDGWLTTRANTRTAVKVMLTVPGREIGRASCRERVSSPV